MYPVSEQFKTEIRYGATIVTHASVWYAGELVVEDLPIKSGTVTDDSTNLIRRRCTLDIEAAENWVHLIPGMGNNVHGSLTIKDRALWPIGYEIKLRQGVKYRNISLGTEWVPMGTFRIAKPRVKATADGELTVSLEGYDMSRTLSRARFTDAYNIPYGKNISDAVKEMILFQCPWITPEDFDFTQIEGLSASPGSVGQIYLPNLVFDRDDDPWKQATEMCKDSGIDLRISLDDKIVMRPIPLLSYDDPHFDYVEGEDCILTGLDRDLDDEDGYNGVIVTGENSTNDTVIRVEIWDRDPESPTYYDPSIPTASNYRKYPKHLTSNYIASEAQAQMGGLADFYSLSGIIESMTFSAVPMFAHESYDLLRIKHENTKVDGAFILEAYTLGLGAAGHLQGRVRSRRVV